MCSTICGADLGWSEQHVTAESKIKDSGNRRQFESGAVRDIDTNKGRCDLLPLTAISELYPDNVKCIFLEIDRFIEGKEFRHLICAVALFCKLPGQNKSVSEQILDVSIHYRDGCEKYGERNWEKGLPIHSYMDSGIRHLLKYLDGQTDENHGRAFVWNMLCAVWTMQHMPKLFDIELPVRG